MPLSDLSKITRFRLTTQHEQDVLENAYYMGEEGRLVWDSSKTGPLPDPIPEGRLPEADEDCDDGRVDVDDSIVDYLMAEISRSNVMGRMSEVSKDYQRYMNRLVVDGHRQGTVGDAVELERKNLRLAYKTLGELMATVLPRTADAAVQSGKILLTAAAEWPEELLTQSVKESLRLALPEIEYDIPPSLIKALKLDEEVDEELAPKRPQPQSQPAAARLSSQPSGRRKVVKPKGPVVSTLQMQQQLVPATSALVANHNREVQSWKDKESEWDMEKNGLESQLRQEKEKSKELERKLKLAERRYELDMKEWVAPFQQNCRELEHARGALEDHGVRNAAKRVIVAAAPWDLKARPFNNDTSSARKFPESFKFATKALTRI